MNPARCRRKWTLQIRDCRFRVDGPDGSASATSCSVSGAATTLTATAATDSAFDFFPGQAGARVSGQIRLAANQFRLLPVVNRHLVRRDRQVVSQVLDQLQFLGRAQVKH